MNVRCPCNNLKKEWLCQEVLKAYRSSGRDPKDIPKNQFGVGILSCSIECENKANVVKSELQHRKANETKVQIVDCHYKFSISWFFIC